MSGRARPLLARPARLRLAWPIFLALWLGVCGSAAPAPTASSPALAAIPPDPPQPTLAPGATIPADPTPHSQQTFAVASTATAAISLAPGWTRYDSLNEVWDLAFAPDGTLWAMTQGGLVRWDLESGSLARYQLRAGQIAPAPDGSLWLAQEEGVWHFDGFACTRYTAAHGLLPGGVHAIAVAPDGTLWAGTEAGARRFDGTVWTVYRFPSAIYDLAIAPGGEVWAATAGGVARHRPGQDAWTTYTQAQGLPAAHAQRIALSLGGEVWAYVVYQGLFRFDGAGWAAVDASSASLVSDLAFAADGTPWVAFVGSLHYPGGHLAFHDGDTWVDVTTAHGLQSISAVALGPDGEVAAGTSLGVALAQGDGWRLLREGPTRSRVTAVAVTPDGAAWFGFGDHSVSTPGGGLSRFDGQAWSYFLGDAEVNALAVAPDGTLWAGVGCEVQRYDGQAWQVVSRCGQHLPAGNVAAIAFTPDGAAWIANAFGLARWDGQGWTVHEKLVNAVLAAPDGSVWVSGWEGTQGSDFVARVDRDAWTTYRPGEAYPGGFFPRAVTPDGRVWGTTATGGLAAFHGGSWADSAAWTVYPGAGDLPLDGVTALGVAPDGGLWVVARGGLARLDGEDAAAEVWTAYPTQGELEGGAGGPLAFAPDGAVWLGSLRFDPPRD
jgi:ligand-binding sensor domain-containing protein